MWKVAVKGILAKKFRVVLTSIAIVLAPEIFGERTRINTPNTVGDQNWTYRLPATLETLEHDATLRVRLELFDELIFESDRAKRQLT